MALLISISLSSHAEHRQHPPFAEAHFFTEAVTDNAHLEGSAVMPARWQHFSSSLRIEGQSGRLQCQRQALVRTGDTASMSV